MRCFCIPSLLVTPFLLITLAPRVGAQATKPAESASQPPPSAAPTAAELSKKETVSSAFLRNFQYMEYGVRSAAEAMPEEKYGYRPAEGKFKNEKPEFGPAEVRTFAQQVKHVAAVNYILGASILGEKPPVELGGENGPDSIKTKADAVKFLKDSFAYFHKAVASINAGNLTAPIRNPFGENMVSRLWIATLNIGHCFDHYGQMAEYLRMNSIIPPASRQ